MGVKDLIKEDYNYFYKTGIVKETLLLQFDQTGRWDEKMGTVPHYIESMLSRTVLNTTQTEETINGKKILKTGFVEKNQKDECILCYHEIKGNIHISHAKNVQAPNLEKCKNLYADKSHNLYLPNLKEIQGSLLARNAKILVCPKLEYITNSLQLDDLKDLELPMLKQIGYDLIATFALNLYIPKCEKIEKCLYVPQLQNIIAPNLKQVGSLALENVTTRTIAKLIEPLKTEIITTLLKEEKELGVLKSNNVAEAFSKELLKRSIRLLEPTDTEIAL